jgi:ABC-type dipeptide/oligopeptide/nickel transport system ATPase component
VGDAAFQRKCLGKMSDVAHEGRAILFVSHNLEAVAETVQPLYLARRRQTADGRRSGDVVRAYLESGSERDSSSYRMAVVAARMCPSCCARRPSSNAVDEPSAAICFGESFAIRLRWEIARDCQEPRSSFKYVDTQGAAHLRASTQESDFEIEPGMVEKRFAACRRTCFAPVTMASRSPARAHVPVSCTWTAA